jgi:hypothetical protein
VALLISTLSYPEGCAFSQDELNRRKDKYMSTERLITDLGKEHQLMIAELFQISYEDGSRDSLITASLKFIYLVC